MLVSVSLGKCRCGKGIRPGRISTLCKGRDAQGWNRTELRTKTSTDAIYRAAILTAGDLDSVSDPTRTSAGVALAATLERHGVRLTALAKNSAKPQPGIVEMEEYEGIVISVANEERPADWMATARQNRWKRAHLVHFAQRALSIRTMTV